MKLLTTPFISKLTKLIFCAAIVLALHPTQNIDAQQDARYTHYMFNGMVLNPAYAGSAGTTSITAIYRKQWVNFDGAPTTISLNGHTALGNNKQFGVGGFLEYDKIGVHQRIRVYGAYSYRLALGKGHLGLGIQGGILQMQSNFSELELGENIGDIVFTENISRLLPNFGLGLYYNTPSFYVGASVPHLLNNRLDNNDQANIELLGRQYRHYLFTAGVVLPLGSSLKVMPSALVKTIPGNAPTQFDATLSFLIAETLWVGSSFRFEQGFNPESLDFILGVQLKNGLRISYGYDLSLNDLSNYNSGSHEIMLGFDFPGKDFRIKTPRYF